ncbi:MAG: ATP-binding protein [Burkholderiales bacterium]
MPTRENANSAVSAETVVRAPYGWHEAFQLLDETQRIAHVGSWSYDRASRRLWCSQEACRILGLGPAAAASRSAILRRAHPDDRRLLLRAASAALQGTRIDIEFRVIPGLQQIRWVQLRTEPPLIAQEAPVALRGALLDITERKNDAVCRTMEHAVTRALLEAESVGQALSQVIRIICVSLGWDYGARWQQCEDPRALHACEFWCAPAVDAANLVAEQAERALAAAAPRRELLQQVLDSGKILWRADVRHDPDFLRAAAAAQAGLRSAIMFPIVSRNGPIGVLEFLSRDSRKPDDVLLEAVEAIGSQIGQYVERKHAEDARRAADERLKRITANVPDVVFQFKRAADGSFSLPFVSERIHDLIGERAADVMRDPTLLFAPVPHGQRLALMKSMLQSKRSGKPWAFETLIQCRSGERKWMRGQASVSYGDDGAVLWDGVLSDITLHKRAAIDILTLNEKLERRVAERTRQLEMINKELEAFSYSVSHDLRAPLRAVEGFSRLLQQKYGQALDESANDYLQRIQRAALRMNELVDDLLKLSRISRTEIKRETIDLSIMAQAILKELRDGAPERAVDITVEDGLAVNGDARLLRIMMENLLGNAWKFTQKTPRARIAVGSAVDEGKKVFFINDNGAGFDMARAHKLFGAFQRLHRTSDFEGTGIGLATVQRIVALHGGRVWAKGIAGQGATFYFSL